uniref:hypothetical protein n=1 Tax=Streptomyces prasinopilosus TaxID=67344 RepID=UPI000AB46F28
TGAAAAAGTSGPAPRAAARARTAVERQPDRAAAPAAHGDRRPDPEPADLDVRLPLLAGLLDAGP